MCMTCPIPSQSARSRALARAVDRPTTRTLLEVWEEMKFVLDTMTSNTGPLSSPGNQQRFSVCFGVLTVIRQIKWSYPASYRAGGSHQWWEWLLSERSFGSASSCSLRPTSLVWWRWGRPARSLSCLGSRHPSAPPRCTHVRTRKVFHIISIACDSSRLWFQLFH